MTNRAQIIRILKAAVKRLEQMEDMPVSGLADEGGYSEGLAPLSFFDLHINESEDGEILLHWEYGFED